MTHPHGSKNRGDRGSSLTAQVCSNLLSTPLISTVVSLDLFDFTVSDTFVRSYFGSSHDLHSNGDVHILALCSLFHYWIIWDCRTNGSCYSTSPRLRVKLIFGKENRYPFRGQIPVMSCPNSNNSTAKVVKKLFPPKVFSFFRGAYQYPRRRVVNRWRG